MKCFYHNDMDGHCSGAIVYKYMKEEGVELLDSDFIEVNYSQPFPLDKVSEDELVIIVDFSLEKIEDFRKLLELTPNVVWIDHHKTAIEKYPESEFKCEGVRKIGEAACVLTWQYFYPGKTIPLAVDLLGDYDVWTFKYKNKTENFQYGVKIEDTRPTSKIWEQWLDPWSMCDTEIENGAIIRGYIKNVNSNTCKNWMFKSELEGYKVVCCNFSGQGLKLFDSVKEEFDIMSTFTFNGEKWVVSLFTKKDNIDVSEIAKKYGGGGHRKAAGFSCLELPFKKS